MTISTTGITLYSFFSYFALQIIAKYWPSIHAATPQSDPIEPPYWQGNKKIPTAAADQKPENRPGTSVHVTRLETGLTHPYHNPNQRPPG
jgi:hypothetical protein